MSLFEGVILDQYTLTYKRINSKKLQTWVHWPLHRAPAHKLHTLSSGYQGWLLSWAGWQRLQSCHWSLVEVSLHVKLQRGVKWFEEGWMGCRGLFVTCTYLVSMMMAPRSPLCLRAVRRLCWVAADQHEQGSLEGGRATNWTTPQGADLEQLEQPGARTACCCCSQRLERSKVSVWAKRARRHSKNCHSCIKRGRSKKGDKL